MAKSDATVPDRMRQDAARNEAARTEILRTDARRSLGDNLEQADALIKAAYELSDGFAVARAAR
jgi:hypothetical protein